MTVSKQNNMPLEDVMVAMDVVDTLRHQQSLVDRELDNESRRSRLLDRLRDIYRGQGIEVSDRVLEEGIAALEQERFKYQPKTPPGSSRLALWYVRRENWGKPFLGLVFLIGLLMSVFYFADVRPRQLEQSAIPKQISNSLNEIRSVAKDPALIAQSEQLAASAQAAFSSHKFKEAKSIQNDMETTLKVLRQNYQLRILSRPNELSGVWRNAEINRNNKNYYLIVEAIDSNNKKLSLPILNEENGKTKTVSKWGIRVSRETFNQVANDKRDDGIIQSNIVGVKIPGELVVQYKIPTSGASITQW